MREEIPVYSSSEMMIKMGKYVEEDGKINLITVIDLVQAIFRERGFFVGKELGRDRNVRIMIDLCQDLGLNYEHTAINIKASYNLKTKEARGYMKLYWKKEKEITI